MIARILLVLGIRFDVLTRAQAAEELLGRPLERDSLVSYVGELEGRIRRRR